ncbi:MAG: hypothetical protein ACRC2J_09945 [Microcoleaceae cyanobacterium]
MNLSVLTRRLMTVVTSGAGIACTVALVAPASFAQQASISGASTMATPSGFVSSVSMEAVLANGANFSGPFSVTPTYKTIGIDGQAVDKMTVEGGTVVPPAAAAAGSFEAAAIAKLTAATPEISVGIIRAGAGIDGF